MSTFAKAYVILSKVEFSDKPEKFLHVNQGEGAWTLGGIFQKYNEEAINWDFVNKVLGTCEFNVERASVMLYADSIIKQSVFAHFKREYWERLLLDEVHDQKTANNIFLSGVHIGIRNAAKLAQKVVQCKEDGFIGQYTIRALNNYNQDMFKSHFDKLELANYNNLIEINPNLAWARKGFINRVYEA